MMIVSERTYAGLDAVDAMTPELRRAVHLYGLETVNYFLNAGVKPTAIEGLISAVLRGAKSMGNRYAAGSGVGGTAKVKGKLDEVLTLVGAPFPAAFLLLQLREAGFALVPREPTTAMVEASIAETGKMGLVSKSEKHRGRLRAAIRRYEEFSEQLAADHLGQQRGRA